MADRCGVPNEAQRTGATGRSRTAAGEVISCPNMVIPSGQGEGVKEKGRYALINILPQQ